MSEYMYHSGIKGQKWGIRRFQNEDGTLTEEGKRRYGVTDTGTGGKKNKPKKEKPESSTWKSKDAGYLSDAELNRRNSRLQRERQYRDMTRSKASKAGKWIAATAGTILVTSAIATGKGKMTGVYRDVLNKYGPKAVEAIKNAGSIDLSKLR